jgi:hypothetical protein
LPENTDDAPYKYEVYDILKFALIITRKKMAIFLNILIDALHQRKRLMPCMSLWKKKLLKLEAHWMKKKSRVMIKRRKNGAATHVYLPIRVTL